MLGRDRAGSMVRAGCLTFVLVCLAGAEGIAAQGWNQGSFDGLISEGRYAEALTMIEAADRPEVERDRLRVRTLHQAGDLIGALAAAQNGLQRAPEDLQLLLAATDLASNLGTPIAAGLSARLSQGVEALGGDEPARDWWVERAATYAELAAADERAREERGAAEQRARGVALGSIALALVSLFTLAVRSRRGEVGEKREPSVAGR